MSYSVLHGKLRKLIGQRFAYLSHEWVLVDVLSDRDCVVLQRRASARSSMQADQFGQAQRRCCETLCVPVSDQASGGDQFSEEMLLLLKGKQ